MYDREAKELNRMHANRFTALLFILLAACGGCGGREYETIPTFPVSGQVTVNGAPAQGAIVTLHPETPQPGTKYPLMPSGKVNAEGAFQLTTYEGPDGAPPGDYTVTIEWPDPKWRPPGGGMPPPPPDRLKGKFADRKAPTIKAHVVAGDNRLEPIVLDGVEILAGSNLQ